MRGVVVALGAVVVVGVVAGLYVLLSGKPLPLFSAEVVQVGSSVGAPANSNSASVFSDPAGFSFAIPAGFHTERDVEDSGETILVQSADAQSGFEVYVTQFSDPGSSITKDRIESQAGLTVANDSSVTVAGAQGLEFDSTADTPPTRQAWFAYNGYLFQVFATQSNAQLLDTTLSSWKFNS